jgi:dihydroorotate dehydrogenase
MYRIFFRLFFEPMDAERAHDFALAVLRTVTWPARMRWLLRRLTAPHDPRLEVRALGHTFPTPLGVAAGMDKDARSFRGLWALGFGHIEVGTITPKEQKGTEGKRVARLLADRAVVNKMGFPNPGAVVAARRLQRDGEPILVGVNIGKSKDSKLGAAGADYRASVRNVAPVSDYLVINVSSPNTPGLREMQAVELLRPLVADVREELGGLGIQVPILIKIGPDLPDDELDSIADLSMELQLDGIVAVNTTIDRSVLTKSPQDEVDELSGGGISGAPLKQRSLDVLRRLRARVGDSVVLVSVGGIETADDVWERIVAGATLVQTHTGFMYGGPAWPRKVNRALSRRVREAGRLSIQELVGTADATSERQGPNSNGNGSGVLSALGPVAARDAPATR